MLQAISLKHKVVTFLEGKVTVLINKIHSITETIYTATHHHRHNIHGHMTSQTQYTRPHAITEKLGYRSRIRGVRKDLSIYKHLVWYPFQIQRSKSTILALSAGLLSQPTLQG